MRVLERFGGVEAFKTAPIEDVAWAVLDDIRQHRHGRTYSRDNLVGSIRDSSISFSGPAEISQSDIVPIIDILMEAFEWLRTERLTVEDHEQSDPCYIILTRLGETIESRSDFSSYAKRSYLPRAILQEQIASVSLPAFLGGRYDAAVREAFTQLEIAVRQAAGYGNDRYGSAMMYDAFFAGQKDGSTVAGPLTDVSLEYSERIGVANLFAGAIGYIKNPLSHRSFGIDDARLAASRILLANDLMITLNGHVQKKREHGNR